MIHRFTVPALLLALLPLAAGAQGRPSIQFNGTVDADFATSFAPGGFSDPVHNTGLEIDLTTTVTFSPKLNAVIQTTMNDGIVPAQGAGRTWDDVNFDGVAVNWQYSDKTRITIGDITEGTGYFNYYGNKRSAMVVGEFNLRGASFTRSGFTLSTGATNLGQLDSTGAGIPTNAWATFLKYDLNLGTGGLLTPSLKYTAGIPGSALINAGLSYEATFGSLTLSTDVAVNADATGDEDVGYALLFEPGWSSGNFSLAGTVFYKDAGANPAANAPTATLPPDAGEGSFLPAKALDDVIVYLEPGLTLSKHYAVGLPLEYHDPSTRASNDDYVAVVPTFYVYPGSGVQWWLWAGAAMPLASGSDPSFRAGSELIFRF
jgi:hypothetical protein